MSNKHIGYVYVFLQAVLILTLLMLPTGQDWTIPGWLNMLALTAIAFGLGVMLTASFQLGKAFSANPEPTLQSQLKTRGLYQLVRHPIYLGLLITVGASTLRSQSYLSAGVMCLLAVLLHFKAGWEEQRLAAKFPDYPSYAAKTAKLIPFLKSQTREF